MTSPLISAHPLWHSLQARARSMPSLRALFANDAQRFEKFSVSACGMLLDYSKQQLDQVAMAELLQLARTCELEKKRDAMLAGAPVNQIENRAALHTALRAPRTSQIYAEGQNVVPDVHAVLQRMVTLCERVRRDQWLGFTGRPIRHIVNIGIGGSDLGPLMVCQALAPYARPEVKFHFVSNADGRHLADVLRQVDAAQTLFIVASKTFTTLETMMNANSARTWMLQQGCAESALAQHFVAASSNVPAAQAFGITAENVFPFWDWVGGRYSLWGAIGLSIALCIGPEHFSAFLAGAHAMDQHFATAPLEQNLPVLFALAGIWNVNFLGHRALSIAPYHQRLARFPAYLQQLEMESTGKSVTNDGQWVDYDTCPVLFGEPGTNGQHAYFQMLHQGSHIVPVDFIAVANDDSGLSGHNEILLANCLAQSQAMAFGKTSHEVQQEMPQEQAWLVPHRTFPGNRPSNTLLLHQLTPYSLGALIALYEHKVFVQATLWNINAFDQWGVALGKVLAARLQERLAQTDVPLPDNQNADVSTTGLLRQLTRWKRS